MLRPAERAGTFHRRISLPEKLLPIPKGTFTGNSRQQIPWSGPGDRMEKRNRHFTRQRPRMYFPHSGCEPVSINKMAGAILPGSNRQKTGALLLQQTADGLGRVFRRSALPQLVGGLLHFRQQGIPVFRNQQAFYFLNHLVRRKIKLDQLLDYVSRTGWRACLLKYASSAW